MTLLLAAVGGAGVASAAGQHGGSARAVAGPAAATIDASTESKLTPISPCRIVDTRLKGGQIGSGKTRSFKVRGSGSAFANQGGKADGCGIPSAATAVQVTITAVSPVGTGYLRAYPGVVAPTATFLSFSKGVTISNGGLVTICGGGLCSGDMRVSVYAHATQVVIDVQGYYIKPMYAYVNADGSIDTGTVSRMIVAKHDKVGEYELKLDRNVRHCVVAVSSGGGASPLAVQTFTTGPFALVYLTNSAGAPANGDFNVQIVC